MLADTPLLLDEVCSAPAVLTVCHRLFGAPGEALSDAELRAALRELGVALPPSYCTFLRYYGSDLGGSLEFFGLPRDCLWRDLVLVNRTDETGPPTTLIKIAEDHLGRTFFLDTGRRDSAGECPVLGQSSRQNKVLFYVADNFARFLELAANGHLCHPLIAKPNGREEAWHV